MPTRHHIALLAALLLPLCPAFAADAPPAPSAPSTQASALEPQPIRYSVPLKEQLAIRLQYDQIKAEENLATVDQNVALRTLQFTQVLLRPANASVHANLANLAPSRQKLALLKDELKTALESGNLSQLGDINRDLIIATNHVGTAQAGLVMADLIDPAARKAKLDEVIPQIREQQAKLDTMSQPFRDRAAALDKTADYKPVYKEVSSCVNLTSPQLGDTTRSSNWDFRAATGQYVWRNPKGEIAAIITITPRGFQTIQLEGSKTVDDAYARIRNINTHRLHAGIFEVALSHTAPADEAKLTALAKSLVDFEALAALRPAP